MYFNQLYMFYKFLVYVTLHYCWCEVSFQISAWVVKCSMSLVMKLLKHAPCALTLSNVSILLPSPPLPHLPLPNYYYLKLPWLHP